MNDAGAVFRELWAAPELFRECVDYTARQTGFRGSLIEKDFICSAILSYFSVRLPSTVVFKGGTCLSKVYTAFYRLSEDLDFTIPLPLDARRTQRRILIEPVKETCGKMAPNLPGLAAADHFKGANESTQYLGTWSYRSVTTGATERITIEFGLREPGLLPSEMRPARTLLQNAVTAADWVPPFQINVMALPEIWAEKTRAALTRLAPAIRDFFDLDYALRNLKLDLDDGALIELVRKKLAVPGNGPVLLSAERRAELERQVEGQLRPVLRACDFGQFDLNRIWTALVSLANRLRDT